MNKTIVKLGTVAALVGATTLGLTACSTETPAETETPTATSSPSESVIGGDIVSPETVDITAINNGEATLVVGQALNLVTAAGTESDWSGVSSDESVADFVAGSTGVDGAASFNPGVIAGSVGKSTVELTNNVTGEKVTFIVNVIEKA